MKKPVELTGFSGKVFLALALMAAFALPLACGGGGGGGGDGTTTPTVTSTSPADAATDVAVDANITITFSEAMNQGSVEANVTVSPDPGSVGYSWSGNTLTINPDSSLPEYTNHTVTVAAAALDAEGTALGSPYEFSFRTVDTDTPTVTSTTPTDNATDVLLDTDISLTFSEAMDHASVESNLTISPSAGSYDTTWTGTTLVVDLDAYLADSTNYTVTVGGLAQDAEGTAIGSPYSFDFTTASRPNVVSTIPADDSVSVSTTTDITITFSKAMNQSSTEDAISISGYTGSKDYSWSSATTVVISSLTLSSDTVYTVSVAAFAQDSGGTTLGTSYSFTFSTGAVITGAAVSGQVFSDPESSHDDDLTGAYVVLMSGPPWDADVDYFLNTGASGLYQFDYVQNGSYYPAALLDSNTDDGGADPKFGDAIGKWSDGAMALTVTGTDRTGINIQLVDPEAISGQVFYAGIYSTDVYSDGSIPGELQIYAYAATTAVAVNAEMTLTNRPVPATHYTVADTYEGGSTWMYGLNPYLMPELSVSGKFAYDDTVTQTFDEYIPPGDYSVLAYLELPDHIASDANLVGFADNLANIADTGDDAGRTDITLFDTIQIAGEMKIFSLSSDAVYNSATVTLLNWPLFAPVSNMSLNTDIPAGGWVYQDAPVDLPVAIHAQPDPADAWTLMPVNWTYRAFDHEDEWPNEHFEAGVVQIAAINAIAAGAGTTAQADKTQMVGNLFAYNDTLGQDTPVVGATVTISTGNDVEYLSSGFTFAGAPFTQWADPQFVILNVEPTASGMATVTFSHPDPAITIYPAVVPIRAGEMTIVNPRISDPQGLSGGVIIAGTVNDVGTDSGAGPGVTMDLTHGDGTLLETTLSDSSSEWYFSHVPSLLPVYLTSSKSGYVPLNSGIFNAFENYFDGFPLLPETFAAGIADMLPSINASAWDSTLQSLAWFGFEVNDSEGEKLSGAYLSTDAPGAVIYYWDSSNLIYTTNGPSTAYTGSADPNGPQIFGYAPGTSQGVWHFTVTGAIAGSMDAVINPGELTYWSFD